jgi:hypothetical protein
VVLNSNLDKLDFSIQHVYHKGASMDLSQDQTAFYETTRDRCRSEVSQINNTIASEVQRVKDLLTSLSNRKTAVLQMYGAACEVLGVENDLAEESIDIEF